MPQAPVTQPLLPVASGTKPVSNKVSGPDSIRADADFSDTLKQAEAKQKASKAEVKDVSTTSADKAKADESTLVEPEVVGQDLPQLESSLPQEGVILPVALGITPEPVTVPTNYLTHRSTLPDQSVGFLNAGVVTNVDEQAQLSGPSAPFEVMGLTLPISTGGSEPVATGSVLPMLVPAPNAALGSQVKGTTKLTEAGIDIEVDKGRSLNSEANAELEAKTLLKPLGSNQNTVASNLGESVMPVQSSVMNQNAPVAALTDGQLSVDVQGSLEVEADEGFSQRLMTEQAKALNKPESAQVVKSPASFQAPLGFNQPGWEQRINERINVMIGQQIQNARILLDPPELGALEIKIQVQNEQTNVSFVTNTTGAKDVLESQIPRLREMLEAQGMNLEDVDVSQQNQQQESQAEELADSTMDDNSEGDELMAEGIEMAPVGLVNYYA